MVPCLANPPQNFCFLKKALPLLRYFTVNIYLEKSGCFGTSPIPKKKNNNNNKRNYESLPKEYYYHTLTPA